MSCTSGILFWIEAIYGVRFREKENERNDVYIPSGRVSAPPDTTPEKSSQDSVVEKLRKSISLRFNKSRGKSGKAHRDDLLNGDNKR